MGTVDLARWHFGRSFNGPGAKEADCPCHKAACGLVDAYAVECGQHNPTQVRTIRVSHLVENCPGAP